MKYLNTCAINIKCVLYSMARNAVESNNSFCLLNFPVSAKTYVSHVADIFRVIYDDADTVENKRKDNKLEFRSQPKHIKFQCQFQFFFQSVH